ncbi:hypothetical protein TPY_2777 [Sulfobacillus acidophilus TPY]|nr:hypothetical protein TPY_2777 [Sulfobacillus acidophilus TPY]
MRFLVVFNLEFTVYRHRYIVLVLKIYPCMEYKSIPIRYISSHFGSLFLCQNGIFWG